MAKFPRTCLLACGGLLLAALAYAEPPTPHFYAYEIPVSYASLSGMNASGQLVGWENQGGAGVGFITGPGGVGLTHLSTLNGAWHSYARAVNAAGQVVGSSDEKAFITGPNGVGIRAIAMPVASYQYATATAVNDSGQVAGYYTTARPDGGVDTHSFVTGPDAQGAVTVNGFNPSSTWVTAINNAGNVAGTSYFDDGSLPRSFVTETPGGSPADIGTGAASYFLIRALNDHMRIGGEAMYTTGRFEGDFSHSFVADLGQPLVIKKNLGGGLGYVEAINSLGDYTGAAVGHHRHTRAYVAVQNGKPTDLNALVVNLPDNVILRAGVAINDARQIAASGYATPGHQPKVYIVCPTEECK